MALPSLGNYFQCVGILIKWNQVLIVCRESLSIPSHFPAGWRGGKVIFVRELRVGFVFLLIDKTHQALWMQAHNKQQTHGQLFKTAAIDLFECSVSNLAHYVFIVFRSIELVRKMITGLYDKDCCEILRLSTSYIFCSFLF